MPVDFSSLIIWWPDDFTWAISAVSLFEKKKTTTTQKPLFKMSVEASQNGHLVAVLVPVVLVLLIVAILVAWKLRREFSPLILQLPNKFLLWFNPYSLSVVEMKQKKGSVDMWVAQVFVTFPQRVNPLCFLPLDWTVIFSWLQVADRWNAAFKRLRVPARALKMDTSALQPLKNKQ